MHTVAFCENDPYCVSILAKQWPNVPVFGDIASFTASEGFADVICGGFPCQDISVAGKGAGLSGVRSGLWAEYRRLISEIKPAWVIIENVSALRARGLDQVLGQLDTIGYDAEWHCIPASALGAHHERDRIWIVAYPQRDFIWKQSRRGGWSSRQGAAQLAVNGEARAVAYADSQPTQRLAIAWDQFRTWDAEPEMGRVVHGLPYGLVANELRALGNAVVPQIPFIIGRAIMRLQFTDEGKQ